MPTYYIMDLADDMATTVAKEMPSADEIAACEWLPDRELAVMLPNINAMDSKVGYIGTGLAPAALSTTSFSCFAIALSTCRRCSFQARATGAFINSRVRLNLCRREFAPKWSRALCSRAPGIGSNRNSPDGSLHC
jgi:hypothetical protein